MIWDILRDLAEALLLIVAILAFLVLVGTIIGKWLKWNGKP